MKNIHPKYYPQAKVKCACGHSFTVGSTKPQLQIEVCYRCHPVYTGKKVFVDTAGQVEKYQRRLEKMKKKTKTSQNPKSKH